MKFAVASGGFIGFAIVMGGGLLARRDPTALLLEASIASVVGAMVFRWFSRQMIRGLESARHEQRLAKAREATAAAAAANKAHQAHAKP